MDQPTTMPVNRSRTTQRYKEAPTSHSFRHTFISRLRNVECPKDIRDELGGWASSVSDKYGSPADIRIKQAYLLKGIDAPSGVEMV